MTEQIDLASETARVHRLVPILGMMGVEVIEASTTGAAATIPVGPNVNHFGVAYAGSLFSVAEMLGGVIGEFFDVPGAVPLVKRLEIDFTRPAMTAATARTTFAADEFARVQAETSANGKSNYELVTEVTDEAGTVVARTHGFYQLRVLG